MHACQKNTVVVSQISDHGRGRDRDEASRFCLTAGRGIVLSLLAAMFLRPAVMAEEFSLNESLKAGRLADSEAQLKQLLEKQPKDQQARFSLGLVQFLQAVEQLGQDHYRYGLLSRRNIGVMLTRLPIPTNPEPQAISYKDARQIIQRFLDQLQLAERTLAVVERSNIRLPLDIGLASLDLNGDGKAEENETLWHIAQAIQNPRRTTRTPPESLSTVLDAADVPWLQGYCHLLSAVGEIMLAYDWKDQFERTAHLFYPQVDTPYTFLVDESRQVSPPVAFQNLADVVAFLHTINYQPVEPARMKVALQHLESMITLSRETWTLIDAETDDDHEWLPGQHQKSSTFGIPISADVSRSWREFLDEADALLQGKHLAPFWRGVPGGRITSPDRFHSTLGINVRRLFTDPIRFDLALWIQGTGLASVLEEGTITPIDKWASINSAFRGEFFRFFVWIN